MAVISGGDAQKVARNLLRDVIRDEVRRGTLSGTGEMIGYFFQGLAVSEAYNRASVEAPKRRIAAPEFLTGLLRDETA